MFTRVNIPNQNSTSMTEWPMSRSCLSRSCCLLDVLEIVIDSVMDPTFHVTMSHTTWCSTVHDAQRPSAHVEFTTFRCCWISSCLIAELCVVFFSSQWTNVPQSCTILSTHVMPFEEHCLQKQLTTLFNIFWLDERRAPCWRQCSY